MRFKLLASASFIGTLLSACSPSMFSSDGEDEKVTQAKTYRQVNLECAKVDLSSSVISGPVARQLVNCFNAYGAMEPVEKFVKRLSDAELDTVVQSWNRALFNNPKTLFETEKAREVLDSRKKLDAILSGLGGALADRELLSILMKLLREADSLDRDGLKRAFAKLDSVIDAATFRETHEIGLSLASSRAVKAASSLLTPEFSEILHESLTRLHPAHRSHFDLGGELLSGIADESLPPVIERVTGRNSEEIRDRVPRLSAFLRVVSRDESELLRGITRLFHEMTEPVSCLRGAAVIPDARLHVIGELMRQSNEDSGSYVQRVSRLKLAFMNPLCQYPSALAKHYPSLAQLAGTEAIEPATELIRSFWDAGKAKFLVDVVAELGSDEMSHVAKSMTTIGAQDGAWDRILLVLALLPGKQEAKLARAWQFFSSDDFSVFTRALARMDADEFHALVSGFARLAESGTLERVFESVRAADYSTDRHPFLEIARSLLHDLRDDASLDLLQKVSEMPELLEATVHVSEMSQDGRLKDLSGAMTALFHRFALQGKGGYAVVNEPRFISYAKHDLVAADLNPHLKAAREPISNDACDRIDLSKSLADDSSHYFEEGWENALVCLNADNQHGSAVSAFRFLKREKAENGRGHLANLLGVLRRNPMSGAELGEITDAFIWAFDDGRLERLLQGMRLWIGKTHTHAGEVLRPALDLLAPVFDRGRDRLKSLEGFFAGMLKDPEFPSIAQNLKALGGSGVALFEPGRALIQLARAPETDLERIERWVGNKECTLVHGPEATRARAIEILEDYRTSVNNWELVGGRPRRDYTNKDIRRESKDLLSKLADPAQSHASKPMMRALLGFLVRLKSEGARKGITGGEYFARWIQERSNEWKPISYFYPGEKLPRVRLVNSLDRLELILINVDYVAPGIPPLNYGLKFVGELAEAWGDEPRENWPEEIQRKYKRGKNPITIAEWVERVKSSQARFEKLVGYPRRPKCPQTGPDDDIGDPKSGGISLPDWMPGVPAEEMKAGLFNTRQVISVLDDNVPGADHPNRDGLKLLRDLFFELNSSTPEKHRSPRAGEKNNLSVVMKLARLGVVRQVARQGWTYPVGDTTLIERADAMINAVTSPAMLRFAPTLAKPGLDAIALWELVDSGSSSATLKELRSRIDALRSSPEYERLDFDGMGDPIFDFFAERSESTTARSAARKLRLQLAQEIESGELEQFLLLARRKPDDFYRMLGALGEAIERGELHEFLGVLRRNLSEARPETRR